MNNPTIYQAAIYCRLSRDDDQSGESISIGTQRAILEDYCKERGYTIHKAYIDDGYSGTNFNRPGFQELLRDVESGAINLVITKDLSRLGRDYIMTGYYSEIFFPSKGIRYIAIADNFDSTKNDNEIAPFKNILNDMYAKDISRKIKNAKQQRAKSHQLAISQPPYGYMKGNDKTRLIIDHEAAEVVRLVFSLALSGMGEVAIAKELEARQIPTPAAHKVRNGNTLFARLPPVRDQTPCKWSNGTIGGMLKDRVYTGDMVFFKTERVNYKSKQINAVPEERRVVFKNAHEAIISLEDFEKVQQIRSQHRCPAKLRRENLFRELLFCDCCGHAMTISRKKLLYREADIYLCAHHNRRPDECPQTHIIYHEMLYPYILEQIRSFAKSMKRRKVNSPLKDYVAIEELTPAVLHDVIERIEVGHVKPKSKPGRVIQIYWKLQ